MVACCTIIAININKYSKVNCTLNRVFLIHDVSSLCPLSSGYTHLSQTTEAPGIEVACVLANTPIFWLLGSQDNRDKKDNRDLRNRQITCRGPVDK